MKKLVFVMMAMFTMCIASCGNGSKEISETNDSTAVVDSDSVAVDTLVVDTVIAE